MTSSLPQFSIKDLLEAGVHYGHKTSRWNPRMSSYLFGSRNGVHIIDLQQTAPLLQQASKKVYEVVRKNGRVLFVGTKTQASDIVEQAAKRCGQYYVNHRWLGGMLTNWKTVSVSIKTLRGIDEKLEGSAEGLTKKEILNLSRERDKLHRALGGIMDMGGRPDLLFVIDTNKEHIAISEAKKLGVPVIGIVDSNSDPDSVDMPIPGNDDATRAIELYCQILADAALAGIGEALAASGVDLGAAKDVTAALAQQKEAKKAKVQKYEKKDRVKSDENLVVAGDSSSADEKAKTLVVEKKPSRSVRVESAAVAEDDSADESASEKNSTKKPAAKAPKAAKTAASKKE
jgi:small subunit ribosomal protein S2